MNSFSPQQDKALLAVETWYGGPEQLYKLSGFAGTGKTTLAQHFGKGRHTYYAAFTGKAASVMRSKGCTNATTLHSLIYVPKSKSGQRLEELQKQLEVMLSQADVSAPDLAKLRTAIDLEKENLRKPSFSLNLMSPLLEADLLVIDEASMVNDQMAADILSFGCKVLVLGDPFQLPPVYGEGAFMRGDPDTLLTEVHRQAHDNPILHLATIIREERRLPADSPCVVRGAHQHGPTSEELAKAADQVIVGTNNTRNYCNTRLRHLLQMTDPLPMPGDKVVCTRNNHEYGILNGMVYSVDDARDMGELGIVLELHDGPTVLAHKAPFMGDEVPWALARDAEHFQFGYALTCHKAQGSQWGNVVIVDESRRFGKDRWRWLYTAVTRACEQLAVLP